MGGVGIAATALLGWLTLPRRLNANPIEGLCLGFALAAFGISVEMFLLRLIGVPWAWWIVLVPWAAGAAWLNLKRAPSFDFELSVWQLAPVAAMLATLAAWGSYERAMPLTSQTWDAWAIWLFKAKAFYLDQHFAPYLARSSEFVGQPGYPLLTPLYGTFLYELNGGVSDQLAKAASPCFFVALLGSIHYVARRAAGVPAAAVFTAIAALTPLVQQVGFEFAGYADTALSAYMVLGAGLAYFWLRDGELEDLGAASLALTAAAWTKNEGQLFLAAAGGALALGLFLRRAAWTAWAWLFAPPVALLATWSLVRAGQGVEASGFTLGLDFQMDLFGIALSTMLAKAFTISSLNLTFVAVIVAVGVAVALRAQPAFWVLPGLLGWQFLGALLAYATGRNEINWWLATSADRLLAQMAPLAILTTAVAYGLWAERIPPDPAPEPAPAPALKKKKRKRR